MKKTALSCVVTAGILVYHMICSDLVLADQYPRDEGSSPYEERFDQEEREMMQPGLGQEVEEPSWVQDGNPQDYEDGAWREEEGYRYEGAPAHDAYPQYDEAPRYEEGYAQDDAPHYGDALRHEDEQPYADAPHYQDGMWHGDQEQPYDYQEQPYEHERSDEIREGQ